MLSPSPLRSSSPQFPLYFLDIFSFCQVFICHFSYMTSHALLSNFFLELFFTPTSILISSIFSDQLSYLPRLFLPGCFSQSWILSCRFSVSAIVSSAFMYAAYCILPLRLRDMYLSPITSSTLPWLYSSL